jgi:hypothetical protein
MDIANVLAEKAYQKAIETGHGYIAAFVNVFCAVILIAFYKYFNTYLFSIENTMFKFILESVLSIAFLAVWYRLIHWLLRYKALERLTVYTSLTKYKWWGRRYKALKNN